MFASSEIDAIVEAVRSALRSLPQKRLPPLPEPASYYATECAAYGRIQYHYSLTGLGNERKWKPMFTAEQMEAFARAAIADKDKK